MSLNGAISPPIPKALDAGGSIWLDRRVKARSTLVASALWLVTTLGLAADAGGWVVVDRERGITSSRRDQPGCALSSFRGQGKVHGNVLQVLAMMLDVDTVPQWAYGVDEARLVKRSDPRSEVVYLYSDIPWPVRDRDMIVLRETEVLKPGEEFRMNLQCRPEARPERDGVVRVKKCKSSFHLRKVDAENTEVDYVMSLDPGGHLPDWVSGFVSKTVPYKTLVAIEDRAEKSRGHYETVVTHWSTAM